MWKVALAVFLVMHGLIHLGYVSPVPADPKYPFNLSKSWLINGVGLAEPSVRLLGITLSIIAVLGFGLSALAALGIVIPQGWWLPLITISALASLLLLVLFWHPWLLIGILIDAVLIAAALWLRWQPFSTAAS
jgi:hypothetical protein